MLVRLCSFSEKPDGGFWRNFAIWAARRRRRVSSRSGAQSSAWESISTASS